MHNVSYCLVIHLIYRSDLYNLYAKMFILMTDVMDRNFVSPLTVALSKGVDLTGLLGGHKRRLGEVPQKLKLIL